MFGLIQDPCALDPLGQDCLLARWPDLLPWVIGIVAAAGLVLVWLWWRGRRQPGLPLRPPLREVQPTLTGPNESRIITPARLVIEQGRTDLVGRHIPLGGQKTTVGRNPETTTVQLYGARENSTISGLHCTIQYDPQERRFLLTDDNSTNGTRVNGQRLRPHVPRELRHGDVVVLGDLDRNGAQLRFVLAHPPPPPPAAPPAPRRDAALTPPQGEPTVFDEADLHRLPDKEPGRGDEEQGQETVFDTPGPPDEDDQEKGDEELSLREMHERLLRMGPMAAGGPTEPDLPRTEAEPGTPAPNRQARPPRKKKERKEEQDDDWLKHL